MNDIVLFDVIASNGVILSKGQFIKDVLSDRSCLLPEKWLMFEINIFQSYSPVSRDIDIIIWLSQFSYLLTLLSGLDSSMYYV